MATDSALRVKKWADYLYSFAAIIVFVFILPIAILSMVYFVFEPVLPDPTVRIFMSAAVGVFIGGMLLITVAKRRVLGTTLLITSNISLALSLSIGWHAIHATVVVFHVFSIFSLIILFNLYRYNEISSRLWGATGKILSLIIITTAPIATFLSVLFFTNLLGVSLTASLFVLYIYIQVAQYIVRDARGGIFGIVLLSMVLGLITVFIITSFPVAPGPIEQVSSFLVGIGFGMVAVSQMFRRMQLYLFSRRQKKPQDDSRLRTMTMLGIELEESESLFEEEEVEEVPRTPWLIDPYTAHAISGVGLVLAALGEPLLFMMFAAITTWGQVPAFISLMGPIAMLFAFLILAPAPVLLRFAYYLSRERESVITQFIGLLALLMGCSVVFLWTQYFNWLLLHTVFYTSILFVAGITGIFRSIRRLWRLAWLEMVRVFRAVKYWVHEHLLISGLVGDIALTSIVSYLLHPFIMSQSGANLLMLFLAATIFTTVGSIGAAQIRALRSRAILVYPLTIATLTSYAGMTYWVLHYFLQFDILLSAGIASLWYLATVLLKRMGFQTRSVAPLYFAGVIGGCYVGGSLLGLPVVPPLALVLLAPLFWQTYISFVRRHTILTWGAVVFMVLGLIAWLFMQQLLLTNPLLYGSLLSSAYFLFFLPAPLRDVGVSDTKKQAGIILLGASLAVFTYSYLVFIELPLRLATAASIFLACPSVGKSFFSEETRTSILITLWTSLDINLALLVFYYLLPGMGLLQAGSLACLVFGVVWTPIRILGVSRRVSNAVYLISVVPAGALYAFLTTTDLFITGMVAVLLPIPVLYELYLLVLSRSARFIKHVLRILYVVAVANLVIAGAVVSILLAAYLIQYLMPLFSSHSAPIISASMMFLLLTFVFWFPALFKRRGNHPNLYSSVLLVFSILIGVNVANLIHIGDLIFTGSLALFITLVLIGLTRHHYPQPIQDNIFAIIWISLLFSGLYYYYLFYLTADMFSRSFMIFLFGMGLLPLRYSALKGRVLDVAYLLIATPSGVFCVYLLGYAIPLMAIVALLIPLPVFYREYALAIRTFAYYVTLFLVISAAMVGLAFAIVVLWMLLPMSFHPVIPYLHLFLIPAVVFLLIWIPALIARRDQNPVLLVVCVYIFDFLVSCTFSVLLQIPNLILFLQFTLLFFGLLSSLTSAFLDKPLALRLSLTILLGNIFTSWFLILPIHPFSKTLFVALGYVIILGLYIPAKRRMLIIYPLVTGLGLGGIMSMLYLPGYDSILFILLYLTIESFLLNLPRSMRRFPTWWAFSISLSALVSYILLPYSPFAPIPGLLLASEMIRRTPNPPADFNEYSLWFGILRSILFSLSVFLLSYTRIDAFLSLYLSVFVGLVTLYFSGGADITETITAFLAMGAVFFLSLGVVTFLTSTMHIDSGYAALMGLAPILLLCLIRSWSGPYPHFHWRLFGAITSVIIGNMWTLVYPLPSSIPLFAMTALFAYSLFELWRPRDGLSHGIIQVVSSGLFTLLLEIIWIWHSLLVYSLPLMQMALGAALISLTLIAMPMTQPVTWLQFEPVWELVSLANAIIIVVSTSGINPFVPLHENLVIFGSSVMIIFSLIATPAFYFGERASRLPNWQRVTYGAFTPLVIGVIPYTALTNFAMTGNILYSLAMAGFYFTGASLIMYLLKGEIPSTAVITLDAIGATSISILFFYSLVRAFSLNVLIIFTIAVWLITGAWVVRPLVLLIVRAIDRQYRENFDTAVIAMPLIYGAIAGVLTLYATPEIFVAGLPIGQYFATCSVGSLIALLTVGIQSLEYGDHDHTWPQRMGVALTGVLLFCYLTVKTLPPTPVSQVAMLSVLLQQACYSSFGMAFSGLLMKRILAARVSWLLFGLFGGAAFYANAMMIGHVTSFTIVQSLGIFLLFEVPLLWPAIVFIARNFFNLGVLLVRAFKKVMRYLYALFERWGFVMWSLFSAAFAITLGILSFPFFSDLVGMNPNSPLYFIPSLSMPLLILGLLLILITIIRRRVRSIFGYGSTATAMVGGSSTFVVVLIDHQLITLAILMFLLTLFAGTLMVNRRYEINSLYLTLSWIPVPISGSIALLFVLWPIALTLQLQVLVAFASFYLSLWLLLLSMRIDWVPRKYGRHLWVMISAFTFVIIYLASSLALFSVEASFYFAVFVASLTLYPVIGREMRQLFIGLVSFGVTGFAFIFLSNVFYQSILLATTAFLLFLSRFLKAREAENIRLVYARFFALICLFATVSLFILSMVF